jgi:hypothetical protein
MHNHFVMPKQNLKKDETVYIVKCLKNLVPQNLQIHGKINLDFVELNSLSDDLSIVLNVH